jgi:hypothetical protein
MNLTWSYDHERKQKTSIEFDLDVLSFLKNMKLTSLYGLVVELLGTINS